MRNDDATSQKGRTNMSYAATKVMMIRHAEKPIPAETTPPPTPAYNGIDIFGDADEDSLIPLGWQRAGALNSLFSSCFGPLPVPQFLFAPNNSQSRVSHWFDQ
jgi:hypothetical protein